MNNNNFKGKIHLILGPMFSSKTTCLLMRFKRYQLGGKKCLMVKYKKDIRYDEYKVVTHDLVKNDAKICEYLYEIDDIVNNFDVICIDEIQFYHDAYIFCDKWANSGLILELCGLNGTFDRKPFKIISELIPLVYNITFLTSVCKESGEDGIYSLRLVDDNIETLIGGSELYKATDRTTYFKNINLDKYKLDIILDFFKIYVKDKKFYENYKLKFKEFVVKEKFDLNSNYENLVKNFLNKIEF